MGLELTCLVRTLANFKPFLVFEPPASNLTYSGIYRFLNNPERVLGLAGIWGTALITWTPPIFYLAATAHILNLAFLQFVERKHMQK
jgi:phosphatidylethanolamine N-methyltransferase